MTLISSRDNPKLRLLRRLAESRGRRRTAEQVAGRTGRILSSDENLLLLEGPHLIDAALGAGVELLQVYACPNPRPTVASVLARLDNLEPAPERFEVAEELLHQAVEAETSQGICALAICPLRPLPPTRKRGPVIALWLDRLKDPGNLGAVLRVAEAAGVAIVGVSPASASWSHPRALRASAGSALRLALRTDVEFATFQEQLDEASGAPCEWVGLSARGEPLERSSLERGPALGEARPPIAIALGSESHGLDPTTEQRCHRLGAIEMAPPVESLNVAVAAGIALYLLRDSRPEERTG